jgi:hypothetical protein
LQKEEGIREEAQGKEKETTTSQYHKGKRKPAKEGRANPTWTTALITTQTPSMPANVSRSQS